MKTLGVAQENDAYIIHSYRTTSSNWQIVIIACWIKKYLVNSCWHITSLVEIIFLSFLKICQCLAGGDESVCNTLFWIALCWEVSKCAFRWTFDITVHVQIQENFIQYRLDWLQRKNDTQRCWMHIGEELNGPGK